MTIPPERVMQPVRVGVDDALNVYLRQGRSRVTLDPAQISLVRDWLWDASEAAKQLRAKGWGVSQ